MPNSLNAPWLAHAGWFWDLSSDFVNGGKSTPRKLNDLMSLDRWNVWAVDSDYDLKRYDPVEVTENDDIELAWNNPPWASGERQTERDRHVDE